MNSNWTWSNMQPISMTAHLFYNINSCGVDCQDCQVIIFYQLNSVSNSKVWLEKKLGANCINVNASCFCKNYIIDGFSLQIMKKKTQSWSAELILQDYCLQHLVVALGQWATSTNLDFPVNNIKKFNLSNNITTL